MDAKGARFIEKLNDRQKRMEEKYFKKDNKVIVGKKPLSVPKVNQKMVSTATTSGFKDTGNF
jgi:hypothetical protein